MALAHFCSWEDRSGTIHRHTTPHHCRGGEHLAMSAMWLGLLKCRFNGPFLPASTHTSMIVIFAGLLWTIWWFRRVPGHSATHAQMRWYDIVAKLTSCVPDHAGRLRVVADSCQMIIEQQRHFWCLIIALVGPGNKQFHLATLTKSPRRLRRASGPPRLANFMRVSSDIFSHLEAMLDILKKKLMWPGQPVNSAVTRQWVILGDRAQKNYIDIIT